MINQEIKEEALAPPFFMLDHGSLNTGYPVYVAPEVAWICKYMIGLTDKCNLQINFINNE